MTPQAPRRGSVWRTDAGVTVVVVSSTVYNEIASEPTVLVMPVFDTEPGTGFAVALDGDNAGDGGNAGDKRGGWAIPGLITSMRKARLTTFDRQLDAQTLTDVNTMLFKILATPEN